MRLQEYRGFLFLTASEKTAPLEDTLGNVHMALADWPFEDFVCVGRREYLVDCNWKFLMQNPSETYHTSFVHKDSLGPMPLEPIVKFLGSATIGDWDAVHVPSDRSIVPMPGEEAPFPEISTTASTYYLAVPDAAAECDARLRMVDACAAQRCQHNHCHPRLHVPT